MTAIIALEDQPMTVCNRLKLQAEQFLYYLPNLFPTSVSNSNSIKIKGET